MKPAGSSEVIISAVATQTISVCIIGTTPLIMNAMTEKARHQLFMPTGPKSSSEKAASIKHKPIEEFRNSMLYTEGPKETTVLGIDARWFKQSMMVAALDTPGAKKTQIGRLLFVEGIKNIPVYGVPTVFLSIVRQANINRTPDVRTRALLPEWACTLNISYQVPAIRQQSVINLLGAAGICSGVGDWRQEKGSNNYGSFRLCSADDPDFVRIIKTMGRTAQQKAIDTPVPHNNDSANMLRWFDSEASRRGISLVV